MKRGRATHRASTAGIERRWRDLARPLQRDGEPQRGPRLMTFQLPPILTNAQGQVRKAGFELEYAGLELAPTAELIQRLFGGRVEEHGPFHFKVVGTGFGDFSIE